MTVRMDHAVRPHDHISPEGIRLALPCIGGRDFRGGGTAGAADHGRAALARPRPVPTAVRS